MEATQYDYIFLGAGCSALSIVMRMIQAEKFQDKKILLIDKEPKSRNDRTWCFWEKEDGFFEKIVYRKWDNLLFKEDNDPVHLDIVPYSYKMIRGIDFYQYCLSVIASQKNIDIIYGAISFTTEELLNVKFNDEVIAVNKKAIIFNSIYQPAKKEIAKFYLLQHFKGWIVESQQDFFTANEAVLMDFRVSQSHGTTFVYVLPLSSNKALIEYTLFTEELLSQQEYNSALEDYCKNYLKLNTYRIIDEEFGVIPMTNAKFHKYKNGMYQIGTAGGQTKASTGYTFRFIQKQAEEIVNELMENNQVSKENNFKKRFYFYDSTLLRILSKNLLEGKTIFSILFKKNRAAIVLKFLDNDTNIFEEIRLLNSLPKKIFIRAGLGEFIKMLLPKR